MYARQTNLFDLLPPRSYAPKPEDIREELHALLATARAATRMPWNERDAQVYAAVFPQMASWLPEPERDELRTEFAAELDRLRAAGT